MAWLSKRKPSKHFKQIEVHNVYVRTISIRQAYDMYANNIQYISLKVIMWILGVKNGSSI